MGEACDKGEKGMPGPASSTFFETNEGGWSEKYVELQRLCHRIRNFLRSNPETAAEVVITKDVMISKLGTNSGMEEIDCLIEGCIQRFRDAKRGPELRVLIAEYEELMFLRTKLLTQIVMAEQQAREISEKYKPEISFWEELRAIRSDMESVLQTVMAKPADTQNFQTGINLDDKQLAKAARAANIEGILNDITSKRYPGV